MATLVQSFPQQSATATMLHARPSSSSGHFQQVSSKHQRGSSAPLNTYSAGSQGTYRGQKMTAPVAPYAFTTTPSLSSPSGNPLRQHPTPIHLCEEDRSASAPAATVSSNGATVSEFPTMGSLPDVDTSAAFADTDVTNMATTPTESAPRPTASDISVASVSKPGPNRYRRVQKRSESVPAPVQSGLSGGGLTDGYQQVAPPYSTPILQSETRTQPAPPPPFRTYASVVSTPYIPIRKEHKPYVSQPVRPVPVPRTSSDDSMVSSRSTSRPSSKREGSGASPLTNAATVYDASTIRPDGIRSDVKQITIPPRGSSDIQKRINQSPLSRPITSGTERPSPRDTFASVVASGLANNESSAAARNPDSPAAQQLAALNKKEAKKEAKPSRLRRAFSFGSAAELRKATVENNQNNATAERAKLRKEQYKDEDEAREAAIVQQQEASGLGAGIYSGQGNFFTGSTDNLSISSTASSASLMLRKMGKGVKRTSRSLVGLFRPKSVIGVPAADGPITEASMAQVSMVTVEAEREKVNVNADPHDQAGGGTGFPKLERNSLDAAAISRGERSSSVTAHQNDPARGRSTILGGEKERAEVLAAVKKGILKRYGTDSAGSSPRQRPIDARDMPPVPRIGDSPHSSGPSTPVDSDRGHRRIGSTAIEGEEHFMSVARLAAGDNRNGLDTPRSAAARNISFSPRIQFHDTWPSQEYDRRGDIATCNRLTPSLAQAIKEELNTFKMEMEVHESSKVYTHFF